MINRMMKPPRNPGQPMGQSGPGYRDISQPPSRIGIAPNMTFDQYIDKTSARIGQGMDQFRTGLDRVEMDYVNAGSVFQPGSPLREEVGRGDYGDRAQQLMELIVLREETGMEIPPEWIEELNLILTRQQGTYGDPMYDRDAGQSKPRSPYVAPGFGRPLGGGR